MTEDDSVVALVTPVPEQITYGPDAHNVADVHRGSAAVLYPLVVFLHGGFWRPDRDRAHSRPFGAALATRGPTVVCPEYRRIPGDPDTTIADVSLALTALPASIAGHDGTVALVGHSAGGHLALLQASRTPALVRVVGLAAVADLAMAYRLRLGSGAVEAYLGGPPERRTDLDPTVGRVRAPDPHRVDEDRPSDSPWPGRAVLLHGTADETVPVAVSRSYVRAHPETELRELPGASHYDVIDPRSRWFGDVVAAVRGSA